MYRETNVLDLHLCSLICIERTIILCLFVGGFTISGVPLYIIILYTPYNRTLHPKLSCLITF